MGKASNGTKNYSTKCSIPKFVYNSSGNSPSPPNDPMSRFQARHFNAAQTEFYHEFQDALRDIRTKNSTRLDALYLTFLGFQYQSIYSRSALVLNFKYETVLNEREPPTERIVCIVLNREDPKNDPNSGGDQDKKNGVEPRNELDSKNLIWGLIMTVNKDQCGSKSCCIEVLSEITELDSHQLLLELTTSRRDVLALASNKYSVQFTLMKDMKFLGTDLNSELTPVLLGDVGQNTEPHYLKECVGQMSESLAENAEDLNPAQVKALKWCLEHKLSVVQGPPGTGKSHLALQLMKMLSTVDGMKPILFITVKNAVLDSSILKLINMKAFHKESILRLGQQYDKTLTQIEEISTNSLWYQKQKDGARSHKLKSLSKKNKELQQIYENTEETFIKVDENRTMDLPMIWNELTNEQRDKFVEHGRDFHPDDIRSRAEHVIMFEDVKNALARWCPEKKTLKYIKKREPWISPVSQVPNERKCIPRDRDINLAKEDKMTVESNIFQIREPTVFTSFHIDDFPYTWTKMDTKMIKNIWDLEPEDRLNFIFSLMYARLTKILSALESDNVNHYENSALKEKYSRQRKGKSFENFAVLATTVHGALMHKQSLSEAGVVAVICEEASQVSERDLLVSLPTSTLHLVMIGDSKQLPPFCNMKSLQDENISLMTRMINDSHPYTALIEQFRMISPLTDLIQDIYPDLRTVTVPRSTPATHIKHPVYWWNHHSYEYRDISPRNELEVPKICALAKYLLLHLSDPTRITILAGYQGQIAAIKEMIEYRCSSHNDTSKLRQIQVRTVDSYQGSENDYILLTLVRNNPSHAIGFMGLSGRRCVALSRARLAMYIVGSKEAYKQSEWGKVIERLEWKGMIGDSLPLVNEKGEGVHMETAGQLFDMCEVVARHGPGNWKGAEHVL